MKRMQITGVGPKHPDGSVNLYTTDHTPYLATALWLEDQNVVPQVGDYLETDVSGSVTLVAEDHISLPPNPSPEPSEAQKKTTQSPSELVGGTDLNSGSELSQPSECQAEPAEE